MTRIREAFALMMILWVVTAGSLLLLTVKFLPTDPLANGLPYTQIVTMAQIFFEFAIITGLLAEMMRQNGRDSIRLMWLWRGWLLVVGLATLLSFVDGLGGRHLQQLPAWMNGAVAIILLGFVLECGRAVREKPILVGWIVGMLVVALGFGVGVMAFENPLQARVMSIFSIGLRWNVAYIIAGLALFHAQRPDNDAAWFAMGGVAIAGAMVSLAPLVALGFPAINPWLSLLLVVAVALVWRLSSDSLWQSLSRVAWTTGVVVIGWMLIYAPISPYAIGTRLSDLQMTLAGLTTMLLLVEFGSKAFGETVAVGNWIGAGLVIWAGALFIAGIIQMFLERINGVGYLNTQDQLVPLYVVALVGCFVWGAGAVILMWRWFVSEVIA